MKKFSQLASMLLLGVLTFGFTACSDDDNTENNGQAVVDPINNYPAAPASMKDIASTYLNDIVYPTYKSLATNATTLYDACQTLYKNASSNNWNQADIDAAAEAFKKARQDWEESEAFLYGAAEDNNIDPHIDSWPLDHTELVSALTDAELLAGVKGNDPAKYVYEKNGDFQSVLGFHGMEFVLFRNGKIRTVAELQANDTEEGMTSVKGIDELAYLAAIAGDLRNMVYLLEYGWLGSNAPADHIAVLKANQYVLDGTGTNGLSKAGIAYGEYLSMTGDNGAWFSTWPAALSNVFKGGCSNISQEVYTQKLGQAYRVATGAGEDGDAGNYIESPYSKRSFKDYQDNIYSIKHSLYGTMDNSASAPVQNSLLSYLHANNYDRLANLSSALNGALQALEDAKNSGVAFIDNPGADQVKKCIDAVKNLDDELIKASTWMGQQTEK